MGGVVFAVCIAV